MGNSILLLLILGAFASGAGAILSNTLRVCELREIKKQLDRYEKAFAESIKAQTLIIRNQKQALQKLEPEERLFVVDEEKSDLPKFGDE